jgi:hypothetical protein
VVSSALRDFFATPVSILFILLIIYFYSKSGCKSS